MTGPKQQASHISQAGWGWPLNAKKAHYFPAATIESLCGTWLFAGEREPDQGTSPDDCGMCTRRRTKQREEEQAAAEAKTQEARAPQRAITKFSKASNGRVIRKYVD